MPTKRYTAHLLNRRTGQRHVFSVIAEDARNAAREAFRMLRNELESVQHGPIDYQDICLDYVESPRGTRLSDLR